MFETQAAAGHSNRAPRLLSFSFLNSEKSLRHLGEDEGVDLAISFAENKEAAMFSASFMEIFIVGVVATAYMTFLHGVLIREHVAKSDVISAIGSFIVPAQFRKRGLDLLPHFFAGVFFAAVYSFLFDFMIVGRDFSMFIVGGAVIGMVHGYFISFFMLLGMSSDAIPSPNANEDLRVAFANILLHMAFGTLAGLGFAAKVYNGTVLWYAIYGMVGLLVLKALSLVVFPKGREPGRRIPLPVRMSPRPSER